MGDPARAPRLLESDQREAPKREKEYRQPCENAGLAQPWDELGGAVSAVDGFLQVRRVTVADEVGPDWLFRCEQMHD